MPRKSVQLGLLVVGVAALYWPDTLALGRYWLDQDLNSGTGILIVLLSGFLLFRARKQFERIPIAPVTRAYLPLMACAAANLICWRAGIPTLQLFFLPLILGLAVLSVLGLPALRLAGFAIGFLYFAVPGWGLLGPALQHLTAWAVSVIGPVMRLPVTVSGTTVSLPGGTAFAIEATCSGVDFLTVGLAVAALHGELEHAGLRRRAGLLGAMLLLAIVSNWLRVLLILEIGYRSAMRSALATSDHLLFGWVVFACALLIFVWLAGRSAATPRDTISVGEADVAPAAGMPTHRAYAARRYAAVAAGLFAVPALVYASLLATAVRPDAAVFELPSGHAPWHGPDVSTDPLWQPRFVGAHVERRALYRGVDGQAVEVVAIGFPKQARGMQILNEGNSLLGNSGLVIERVTLVYGAGIPHGEVIVLDPSGRRSVVWSVIDIGGRLFGEPVASQLWYGARSLIGAPYSALFAIRAPCASSCDTARAVLADFLRANGSALFSVPRI